MRTLEHHGTSNGAVRAMRHEDPRDDWLGDVSDDDWDEGVTRAAGDPERTGPAEDAWPEHPEDRPRRAGAADPADARRATTERRRYTAGLVLLVVIGLAVGIPVLLLRGGGGTEAVEPTTSTPTDSLPSTPTTTTPAADSPDATTTDDPSNTPPSTSDGTASPLTLPEGTKLRRGEGDPDLVAQLQRALTAAGYDPGSDDGNYGRRTEAAVVAFQQANDLSADGVVGPATAAALKSALAAG